MKFAPLIYLGAAIAEIAGCYGFWAWLRLGKSAWWLAPSLVSLALFINACAANASRSAISVWNSARQGLGALGDPGERSLKARQRFYPVRAIDVAGFALFAG